MSNLAEIRDETQLAWSSLQSSWFTAREHWRDEVAQRFERERWREWQEEMSTFLIALGNLEDILDDTGRACID